MIDNRLLNTLRALHDLKEVIDDNPLFSAADIARIYNWMHRCQTALKRAKPALPPAA